MNKKMKQKTNNKMKTKKKNQNQIALIKKKIILK